jgi:hypothetical protein
LWWINFIKIKYNNKTYFWYVNREDAIQTVFIFKNRFSKPIFKKAEGTLFSIEENYIIEKIKELK